MKWESYGQIHANVLVITLILQHVQVNFQLLKCVLFLWLKTTLYPHQNCSNRPDDLFQSRCQSLNWVAFRYILNRKRTNILRYLGHFARYLEKKSTICLGNFAWYLGIKFIAKKGESPFLAMNFIPRHNLLST